MGTETTEWSFKKVNVGLVVVLTIVTFGAYLGYWFLREGKTLKVIDCKGLIPIKLWWVFMIYLILSFFYNLLGEVLLTPYGFAVISSVDVVLSFYFLGFLYYSTFRVRDLLEERFENITIKPWLLVLFHVWYLQYKINRLEGIGNEHKEEAYAE
ncbi:MAG TPA: hypothetical protein GX497_01560 [Bacillus bacterium]|nr:hypothetical protein [Bacillus sp. (in: firmicutes)]